MTFEQKCRKLVREWRKEVVLHDGGWWEFYGNCADDLLAILPKRKAKRRKK